MTVEHIAQRYCTIMFVHILCSLVVISSGDKAHQKTVNETKFHFPSKNVNVHYLLLSM